MSNDWQCLVLRSGLHVRKNTSAQYEWSVIAGGACNMINMFPVESKLENQSVERSESFIFFPPAGAEEGREQKLALE